MNATELADELENTYPLDEELREFDVDPIEAKLMIAKLKEKNCA
jgi:hypothetical protein